MLYGIIGIIILAALAFVFMYNGLIRKKNDVENAFSNIDVALKKRHDLIPNLIETVKAYMTHEKDLFTEVTALRSKAMNPNLSMNEKVQAENQLSQAVGGIMVAVERYPDIKANTNFLELQDSFTKIENEISGMRRIFNAAVLELNNAVEMFPTNLVAGMMGLSKREFFIIPKEERENVDAKQLFGNE